MTDHTPEPIILGSAPIDEWVPKIGVRIDWDRLEACVRACKDIPTKQLEAGSVAKLVEAAHRLLTTADETEVDRAPWDLKHALAPFRKD